MRSSWPLVDKTARWKDWKHADDKGKHPALTSKEGLRLAGLKALLARSGFLEAASGSTPKVEVLRAFYTRNSQR
jgi:hypothetical protein